MPVLDSTQALVNDALFRAGEIPGASEWDTKVVDYINRAYRGIAAGAIEFLPEVITDWWWMRSSGVLTIDPVESSFTASVVNGITAMNFNWLPPVSHTGRRFKVEGHPDVFIIQSHTAGTAACVLDSIWTGPTNSAASYKSMKVTYALSQSVQAIMSPVISFRENPQIFGLSPERMDQLFPLQRLSPGVPLAFSLENEQTIRFSHAGRTDDVSMRMEYRFRPVVADLVNTSSSFPLIPLQFRHVLADIVTYYVMVDKNDDRATSVGTGARSLLGAMVKENTRRMKKMDQHAGAILTRPARTDRFNRALRTESGLIIG